MISIKDKHLPANLFLLNSTEDVQEGFPIDRRRKIKLSSSFVVSPFCDALGRIARAHPQEDGSAIIRRATFGKFGKSQQLSYTHLETNDKTVYAGIQFINFASKESKKSVNTKIISLKGYFDLVYRRGNAVIVEFKKPGRWQCLGIDQTCWEVEWDGDSMRISEVMSQSSQYVYWISVLRQMVNQQDHDQVHLRTIQFLSFFSNTKYEEDAKHFVLKNLPGYLKKIKNGIRTEAA